MAQGKTVERSVRIIIGIVGIALVVGAFFSWFAVPIVTVSEESRPTSSTPSVTTKTTEVSNGVTTERTETGVAGAIKTTTTEGAPRSDTVTLALLGLGVLSLLGAAFYGNLESLSAAGLSVKFAHAATTVDELTKLVNNATKTNEDQQESLKALTSSLQKLAARVAAIGPMERADLTEELAEVESALAESQLSIRETAKSRVRTEEAVAAFKQVVQ